MDTIAGRWKQRMTDLRALLTVWQKVADLRRVLEPLINAGDDRTITAPGSSTFRDAYTAMRCAELLGGTEVCLGDDPPDAWVKLAGEIRALEITEVQRPGRKRGDEFKRDAALWESDPSRCLPIDPADFLSATVFLGAIAEGSQKKTAIPYASETTLVIYANIRTWSDAWPAIEEGLGKAVSNAKARYREIWVLWNCHVYRY